MAASGALGRQFTRAHLRDTVRHAQHAQDTRASLATRGHRTESRTFYRGRDMPQTDTSEDRVHVAAADREHRAMRAYDAEQAAKHVPMPDTEREAIHRDLEAAGWH